MAMIADMPPYSEGDGATPTPEATPQGQEQVTPEAPTADPAESFTKLDPNALPPELKPFYNSMLGDYTRKTQEIAPYRQLASEMGLEPNDLRQAAELFTALQDPQQVVQFHQELSAALQEQGLSPAEANAAATQHVQQQQAETAFSDDPEERRFQELEQRLNQLNQTVEQREQELTRREQLARDVAEMNRMESAVRESYPHFKQEDVDMAYELSPFYGGDLIAAAGRWQEQISNRVAEILNSKGAVASNPAHAPLPPALPNVTRPQKFDTVEEGHKAAMALIKSMPPMPRPT